MIHFYWVDFSECHSQEVISFFWRTVYNWRYLPSNIWAFWGLLSHLKPLIIMSTSWGFRLMNVISGSALVSSDRLSLWIIPGRNIKHECISLFTFLLCIYVYDAPCGIQSTARPHHSVMAARDFNRRQSIFMSFRFIFSNTNILAPFPFIMEMHAYKDQQRRGASQQGLCRLTGIIYLCQSMRTHSACASTANNGAGKDAVMLDTLIAPCINKYWLPSVVVMKGACQSCA